MTWACSCAKGGSYILQCSRHGTRATLIYRATEKLREMDVEALRAFLGDPS